MNRLVKGFKNDIRVEIKNSFSYGKESHSIDFELKFDENKSFIYRGILFYGNVFIKYNKITKEIFASCSNLYRQDNKWLTDSSRMFIMELSVKLVDHYITENPNFLIELQKENDKDQIERIDQEILDLEFRVMQLEAKKKMIQTRTY